MADCQPDTSEESSHVNGFLFSLFPVSMEPLKALEILDQQQAGTFLQDFVAALVVVAHCFEHGNLIMEGSPAIFAAVAKQILATGMSILSNAGIKNLIEQVFHCRYHSSSILANDMPKGALDRAKFLVNLSELCWQPSFRRKLARRFAADHAFASIAAAWLSIGPAFTVKSGAHFANENFLNSF